MFQSFEVRTRPQDGPPRLAALREAMQNAQVDGFLVPRADAYQGEYVAPCDERLAWLTGFTGSAGFCAVLNDRAGLFVDGRYRLQGRAQAADAFEIVAWPNTKLGDWLVNACPNGARVGYDAWLHTAKEIDALKTALNGSGISLVAVDNLVDAVWTDRPAPPCGLAKSQPIEFAGEASGDKRARIGAVLAEAGQSSAVLTLPDSISWLLNIRGSDIPRNPVVHAFAILHASGKVHLFTDPDKVAALGPDPNVDVTPMAGFASALGGLTGKVRLDKGNAPQAVSNLLREAGVAFDWGEDPCVLPKACKNPAEIAGTREAHLRDGAAMVEFLAWLDAQEPGSLTEIAVATKLEGFRQATGVLRDISFETICGAGPNGAIVHYRVTEETNRQIQPGELLLVDSGGQYEDGTTDITRTIAMGAPPDDAVAACTRVLQGMIAVSMARWPEGLAGRDLDALARAPLWRAGQDYDHGTGHGVGVYLSVHEGPQRLSRVSDTPLQPGMILSNEPGYYREGAFGIRIENLVVVQPADIPEGGDTHRKMLSFETLTFVPIDARLVNTAELTAAERAWLNAYHADVEAKISPHVSAFAHGWLKRATRAI
ncbi:aminopeptidase P family protein [Tropicimonas sp. S265A]|uniref:aminopeptidase P family protein n=1 Tax=Tropicimonas sp. S265A TaxID=3415134 RepID=UPI003C7AD554